MKNMASLVNYFMNFAAVFLFLCHRFASVNALPVCPFVCLGGDSVKCGCGRRMRTEDADGRTK